MLHYIMDEALETTELQMMLVRHRYGERTVVLWRWRSVSAGADSSVFFIRLLFHVWISRAIAEGIPRYGKGE